MMCFVIINSVILNLVLCIWILDICVWTWAALTVHNRDVPATQLKLSRPHIRHWSSRRPAWTRQATNWYCTTATDCTAHHQILHRCDKHPGSPLRRTSRSGLRVSRSVKCWALCRQPCRLKLWAVSKARNWTRYIRNCKYHRIFVLLAAYRFVWVFRPNLTPCGCWDLKMQKLINRFWFTV